MAIPWSRDSVVWWESRRIVFNLALLATGIVTILVIAAINDLPDAPIAFGVVAYAAAANFFYTLGWISEILWSGGDTARTEPFRRRVFYAGLVFSILLTLLPAALIGLLAILQRIFAA